MTEKMILKNMSMNAFYIRRTYSGTPILQDLWKKIQALDFDGISKGKENLCGDSMKLKNDFIKATAEAKRKLQHGESLF